MRVASPVEIREAEGGQHLYGVLIQEGRAARRRREVFAPGSVQWPSDGVGILTRHHGDPETRAVPTREVDGRITLRVRATKAIREAVAAGRRFMSVEFHALRERRTEGGIREILRALVPDVALVASPEYGQTSAEVRRRLGPRIRSMVPTGRAMDCRCPGGGCDTIEFEADAFEGLESALATTGTMDQVIGNAVLTPGRGGLGIEVDLLDVAASRDLLALLTGGVAVYSRPLIDLEASETSEDRREGGTLYVRKAVFGAVIVKPVSRGVAGMDPVRLSEDRETRQGPSQRRLRLLGAV